MLLTGTHTHTNTTTNTHTHTHTHAHILPQKGLINRDPPLVSRHSNPPKYRLVHPHGLLVGATIYKDAVARGKMPAAPGADPESDIREMQAAVDALEAAAAGSGRRMAANKAAIGARRRAMCVTVSCAAPPGPGTH